MHRRERVLDMQVRKLLCNREQSFVMMAYGISAAGKTFTIEGTPSNAGVFTSCAAAAVPGVLHTGNCCQ